MIVQELFYTSVDTKAEAKLTPISTLYRSKRYNQPNLYTCTCINNY